MWGSMLALGRASSLGNVFTVMSRPLPLVLCAILSASIVRGQEQRTAAIGKETSPDPVPPRPVVLAYPGGRAPVIGADAAPSPAAPPARTDIQPAVIAMPSRPDTGLQPSWETQKLARNYVLEIPAPRGQITDRNGLPFAQTRVAYNLAINFPQPPQFGEQEASRFIAEQVRRAQEITLRTITLDPARALKQYKERGIMPLIIAQDLNAVELDRLKRSPSPGLIATPIYLRSYPQGKVAAHLIGFVGRQGGYPSGPVENNEPLWPETEGRDGLEKSFNTQLTGKRGVMHVSFDAQGKKAAEKIVSPPRPGQNVVTTLDLNIQQVVERTLIAAKRPCAMVVMDPKTGEILAMASEPAFDPNIYVPSAAPEVIEKLMKDPFNPLYPRSFRAAYPPGSIFKIVTGLSALNDGYVDPGDEFGGEAAITIGSTTFRNWKKSDVGPLNFVEALTQSCNTYFYKMGLKAGHRPILEYASRLGLGNKTGIPIAAEEKGNLMTTEYMMKQYKRRIMPGDIANMSIGQGDTLVTPLQMASIMCTIASGGTVFQPRLVLQVQDIDGRITFGYDVRVRDQIDIHRDTMKALKTGLEAVVSSRAGTAGRAGVSGFKVAGKTGTAQWGSGKKEKVAAWFVGFAPVERPQYAFAVLYEGKPGDNDVHGGTNAAPIAGKVLKEILKPEPKEEKKSTSRKKRAQDDADEEMDEEAPSRRRRKAAPEEVLQ
jgi:penicillin-binding protein 2